MKSLEERSAEISDIFKEFFGNPNEVEGEPKKREPIIQDQTLSPDAAERLQDLFVADPIFKDDLYTPAAVKTRSDTEFRLCARLWEAGFDEDEIYHIMTSSPQTKWLDRNDSYRWDTLRRAVAQSEANRRKAGDPGRQDGGRGKAEAPEISEEELEGSPLVENPRLEIDLEPDNAIMRYIEYGKKTGDAYPEYHYGMALSLHSTVIARNLVLKLSQGEVFPNIWAFMLGRSTISRKSAAIAKGQQFTKDLVPYTSLPQSYSPEGLIEELSEIPRSYLIKDEAGAMLAAMSKNYMLEMRDLYCVLYDCQSYKRKLRSGQRKERKTFEINDPYVNIVTATTPETFREYTTLLDLTSGWLLRFIYFYPNYRKGWMAFKPVDEEDFALYGEVLGRLSRIKGMLYNREKPVEISLEAETWDYYQTWQEAREGELQDATTNTIELALWGRLSFYALKLAMLFTVGRADYQEDTKVSLAHVMEACRQIDDYFLPVGRLVAEEVAREETTNLQNKILGTLSRHGGRILRKDLLKALHATLKDVRDALDALKESEEISIIERKGKGKPALWVILNEKEERSKPKKEWSHKSQWSHRYNSRTNSDDITCSNGIIATNATIATIATIGTFSEDYLNDVLVCRKIKTAISEGITDPLKLAEVVGLPVCTLARNAAMYPGIDLQKAGEVLVTMGRACWWPPKIKEQKLRAEQERQAREEHFKTPASLKAIYKSTGEALEYADLSLNLYAGCSHGCTYCFNRGKFRSPCTETIKKASLENIEHDLKQLAALENKTLVHLSFIGDPFDLGREDNSYTHRVLELFKKYNHPFQILTKGGMKAIQEPDLYFEGCSFGCTLTFDNPEDSKKWEPGAALPEDRIAALELAHRKGIKTWISLEPVIDPFQSLHLIDLTHKFVDHYGVGKINHNAALENAIDWRQFRSDVEAKLKRYGKSYKIKSALAKASQIQEPDAGKPPLICAKCGADLTDHGQVEKNGRVYCAKPGCGYPGREEA
jgi:DNA repair photolyase